MDTQSNSTSNGIGYEQFFFFPLPLFWNGRREISWEREKERKVRKLHIIKQFGTMLYRHSKCGHILIVVCGPLLFPFTVAIAMSVTVNINSNVKSSIRKV